MTHEAIAAAHDRRHDDPELAPKTQQGYIRTIKDFAAFLGRSPDTASFEDVRRFQLLLAASGAHIPILNHTVAALRFFFRVTLRRSDIIEPTTFLHEPRKLPGSVRPSRAMGSRYRHWNAMVAAECAVSWHLLGLSFSFPNWPESHDVRRHRSSLLAWSFWQISCLFAPWTVGVALGL